MATTVARLQAVLTADTGQFDRAMDKSDSRMGSLAKTMGKAGLAGAVVGLGAAVKVGVGEFMEAQKVTAQTNAVIKSTGGAAKTSTAEVQKLSESLMKKSGVDDEAIQSGANVLLTFTKIRNETGKGNKIFDEATKATLNLSVALGKDMNSSAIMVGKALNDPIKGMKAMSRAGVQFTEEQKEQVVHLVKGTKAYEALAKVTGEKFTPEQVRAAIVMQDQGASVADIAKKFNLDLTPAQMKATEEMMKGGQMAEAQKVILKELETQFGGSAEAAGKTFGGQVSIARERLNNFAGSMVEKSIPTLEKMTRVFKEDVVPALKSMHGWVKDNVLPVLGKLKQIGEETWKAIAKVLKDNEEPIGRILGALKSLGEAGLWLSEKVVLPVLKPLFTTVLPTALGFAIKALDLVVSAAGKIKDAFVWLRDKGGAAIGAVWKAAEKPLGLLEDAFQLWWTPIEKIIDGIKWLIDNVKKIPKPDLPGLPDLNPFNNDGDGGVSGALNLMGASSVMMPFAASAAAHGLVVSSGLRPGAVTKHGTPSDHAVGKALDLSNTYKGDPDGTPQMAAFFKSLLGNRSVKEAFYDPLGSIFGGAWSSYREGGHSDHVHVATYDDAMRKPRYLMPGLNLAYNGTGRPEPVGMAGMPNYLILDFGGDGGLIHMVRKGKQRFERLNGPGSW